MRHFNGVCTKPAKELLKQSVVLNSLLKALPQKVPTRDIDS